MPNKTVGDAMGEFKRGELHSGKGGPVVKDRKQAIAIGLSQERKAKGKRSRGRSMKGRR